MRYIYVLLPLVAFALIGDGCATPKKYRASMYASSGVQIVFDDKITSSENCSGLRLRMLDVEAMPKECLVRFRYSLTNESEDNCRVAHWCTELQYGINVEFLLVEYGVTLNWVEDGGAVDAALVPPINSSLILEPNAYIFVNEYQLMFGQNDKSENSLAVKAILRECPDVSTTSSIP